MHWCCWCCWCADAADALMLLMLLMRWCCWCTDAADALMLLMRWCCWCTDADALMLLMHRCYWSNDAAVVDKMQICVWALSSEFRTVVQCLVLTYYWSFCGLLIEQLASNNLSPKGNFVLCYHFLENSTTWDILSLSLMSNWNAHKYCFHSSTWNLS